MTTLLPSPTALRRPDYSSKRARTSILARKSEQQSPVKSGKTSHVSALRVHRGSECDQDIDSDKAYLPPEQQTIVAIASQQMRGPFVGPLNGFFSVDSSFVLIGTNQSQVLLLLGLLLYLPTQHWHFRSAGLRLFTLPYTPPITLIFDAGADRLLRYTRFHVDSSYFRMCSLI